MAIVEFPPLSEATEDGLLAIGGDLHIESLLLAYRNGIFPWPIREDLLAWFSPPQRAVLFFNKLHVPSSLAKAARKTPFSFTFDRAFREVITHCSEVVNRGSQKGTWITRPLKKAYVAFHQSGFAHSVEAWSENELCGGLYGVAIGKYFSGESMFYRRPNASKLCLLVLMELLKSQGVGWIDCQVMTPHLKALGAVEIPRDEYLWLLREALEGPAIEFPDN